MAQPAEEFDEFDEQATAAESGSYDATRNAPVEDQREFRRMPKGTVALLGVTALSLGVSNQKKSPFIRVKFEVNGPAEYADGSANFGVDFYLSPKIGQGAKESAWTVTRKQLSYIYAGIHQCSAQEAAEALFSPVFAQFPEGTIGREDEFRAALLDHLTAELKGGTFTTAVGIQPARKDKETGREFSERQTLGTIAYQKAATK